MSASAAAHRVGNGHGQQRRGHGSLQTRNLSSPNTHRIPTDVWERTPAPLLRRVRVEGLPRPGTASTSAPFPDCALSDRIEELSVELLGGERRGTLSRNVLAQRRRELADLCHRALAIRDPAFAPGLCKALFSAASHGISVPQDVCASCEDVVATMTRDGRLEQPKNVVHYIRALDSMRKLGYHAHASISAWEDALLPSSPRSEACFQALCQLTPVRLVDVLRCCGPTLQRGPGRHLALEAQQALVHHPIPADLAVRALAVLGGHPFRSCGCLDRSCAERLCASIADGAPSLGPCAVRAALVGMGNTDVRSLATLSNLSARVRELTQAGELEPQQAAILVGALATHGIDPGASALAIAARVADERPPAGAEAQDHADWLRAVTELTIACAALKHTPPAALVTVALEATPQVCRTQAPNSVGRFAHALARVLEDGASVGGRGQPHDDVDIIAGEWDEGWERSGSGRDGQVAGGPPAPSSVRGEVQGLIPASAPLVSEACRHLAALVEASQGRMSPRDLARAVWAVARLSRLPGVSVGLDAMLDAVARRHGQPEALRAFEGKSLATLLYAFALAGYSSGELGRAFLTACADRLLGEPSAESDPATHTMGGPVTTGDAITRNDPAATMSDSVTMSDPATVSTALWAFARLGYHPGVPCVNRLTRAVFSPKAITRFPVKGICMVVWACADLAVPVSPRDLALVYEELQRQRGSITSLSVSSLCVSAARLSWFDPEFFALIGAVCEREAPRFSPVGVAATLYGMARVGFYSPGPLRALAGRAKAVAGSMTAQHCTNMLWALAASDHYDGPLVTALVRRLHALLVQALQSLRKAADDGAAGSTTPAGSAVSSALLAPSHTADGPSPGDGSGSMKGSIAVDAPVSDTPASPPRPSLSSPPSPPESSHRPAAIDGDGSPPVRSSDLSFAAPLAWEGGQWEVWGVETASDAFPGQLLAHALYACAVLRHDPGSAFVSDAARLAQLDLASFTPKELCMTMWALTTLGYGPEGLCLEGEGDSRDLFAEEVSLLEVLSDRVYAETAELPLGPRDAVQVAWALASHQMHWHPVMLHVAHRISTLGPQAFAPLTDDPGIDDAVDTPGSLSKQLPVQSRKSRSAEAARVAAVRMDGRGRAITAERRTLLTQLAVVEALSGAAQEALLGDEGVGGEREGEADDESPNVQALDSVQRFAVQLPAPLQRAVDAHADALSRLTTQATTPEHARAMVVRELSARLAATGSVQQSEWLGYPCLEYWPRNGEDSWQVVAVDRADWSCNAPRRLGGIARTVAELSAAQSGADRVAVAFSAKGEAGSGRGGGGAGFVVAAGAVLAVTGNVRVEGVDGAERDEGDDDLPPWWSGLEHLGLAAVELELDDLG